METEPAAPPRPGKRLRKPLRAPPFCPDPASPRLASSRPRIRRGSEGEGAAAGWGQRRVSTFGAEPPPRPAPRQFGKSMEAEGKAVIARCTLTLPDEKITHHVIPNRYRFLVSRFFQCSNQEIKTFSFRLPRVSGWVSRIRSPRLGGEAREVVAYPRGGAVQDMGGLFLRAAI